MAILIDKSKPAAVMPVGQKSGFGSTDLAVTDPFGTPAPSEQPQDGVDAQMAQEEKEEQDNLFNFDQAKIRLQKLEDSWRGELTETDRRRLTRDINVSTRALRDSGKLQPDETIIPIRLCDTNIKREQPAYINYLKGTGRLAVFRCDDDPAQDTQLLETEFSNGLMYPGWDTPHFKVLDGSQTHGWDSIEVAFDSSKRLHVVHEQIGHDNLYFGLDSIDIQACGLIIRRYSWTKFQAIQAVKKFGFNFDAVMELITKKQPTSRTGTDVDCNFFIYKCYFKWQDVVYVAWYNRECSKWIKEPAKLYMGRKKQVQVTTQVPQQVPSIVLAGGGKTARVMVTQMVPQTITEWQDIEETDYPVVILPYNETEQQTIVAHKGRVFYDQYKQEGVTAIASGYVNGMLRAANIYGSVAGDPSSTAAPRQLDTSLAHGKLYDRKVEFFHTDYPDPSTLTALNYFEAQNANEVGQVAYAASNRKDSRKTAAEIDASQQQQAELSSVAVSLYSTFLCKVYTITWLVVQSQALQGKIKFLLIPDPNPAPVQIGQEQPMNQEPALVNNMAVIGRTYLVKAAGDTDVINRAQRISQMKTDWPVIATTPLAMPFLSELIRLSYPDMAGKWVPILQNRTPERQALQALSQAFTQLVNPAAIKALPPQQQQQLAQLDQMVTNVLNPQQAQTPQQTQSPANN